MDPQEIAGAPLRLPHSSMLRSGVAPFGERIVDRRGGASTEELPPTVVVITSRASQYSFVAKLGHGNIHRVASFAFLLQISFVC